MIRIKIHAIIESITCGAFHTVALDSEGQIYCWGRLLYPKENTLKFSNQPEPLLHTVKNVRFKKVSAGTGHTLALDSRGNVWSWGEGIYGQLGHGILDNEYFPKIVESIEGFRFLSIASGGQHSACLLPNGQSIVWGKNQVGQLGTGDKDDRILPTLLQDMRASEVKCGSMHTAWLQGNKIYISGNSKLMPELIVKDIKMFERFILKYCYYIIVYWVCFKPMIEKNSFRNNELNIK